MKKAMNMLMNEVYHTCNWSYHDKLFFGLKFGTNVKNKYEKGIFDHLKKKEKTIIRFAND
jgi:hypothetical protein